MASESTRETGFWLQAYATLGPPVIWAIHFGASYVLVPVACRTGQDIWLHLAAAVPIVLVLGAALSALSLLGSEHDRWLDTDDPRSFLAYFGLLSAALFGLAILLGGVANFLISPCDRSF